MPTDTDTPSPVLENKDSSSLNTTLNDTDLLNDTLDGALYSESTILEQKQQPAGQGSSCPSTPVKKEQPKVSIVAAQNADQMLDMLTVDTVAKNYYFNANEQSNDIKSRFPQDSKITINGDDDCSRYKIEHLNNLFPKDAEKLTARFVVVAKKNDETGKLESELWFSRANHGAISHAGAAFGGEKSGYSLSAGEIHFTKQNGAWVIKEINNQTGHFLCEFKALLLPLKLLLNLNNELVQWGDKVVIGQMANTKSICEGPSSVSLCRHSIDVAKLKARLLNITVTLPDSVPEVVTTLYDFGSPKAQRTVSRPPLQAINNPQPLH
ncbi:MAG: hypothetical protein ACRC0B_00550, partial [Legionella sp.]